MRSVLIIVGLLLLSTTLAGSKPLKGKKNKENNGNGNQISTTTTTTIPPTTAIPPTTTTTTLAPVTANSTKIIPRGCCCVGGVPCAERVRMFFPKRGLDDNGENNDEPNTKMAAKYPDDKSTNSSAVPPVSETYKPGISVHECKKRFNLATPPATELLHPYNEERVYAFVNSEDDEDWKDEILVNDTRIGLPDADTMIQGPSHIAAVKSMDAQLKRKQASEPRLGPVKASEMSFLSAHSESGVQEGRTEEREEIDEEENIDEPSTSKTLQRQRGVRSEGMVKAKERILEFGRSVADIIARPFRRQTRRAMEKKPTPEVTSRQERDTLKTDKMEESKLPVDQLINAKQLSKRRARFGTMSTPAHTLALDSTD